MLVSEFDGMEKYEKKRIKIEKNFKPEEPDEEGELEEQENNHTENLKKDGVHLKYIVSNDRANHPVFNPEPKSLDPSRTTGSDAFLIFKNKRDIKGELKIRR